MYSLGAVGYHLVTGTVPGASGTVDRPDRSRPGSAAGVQRALPRARIRQQRERFSVTDAVLKSVRVPG